MGAELGNRVMPLRKRKIKNYRSSTETPEIRRSGRTLVIHLLDGKTHRRPHRVQNITDNIHKIQRITNTEERVM